MMWYNERMEWSVLVNFLLVACSCLCLTYNYLTQRSQKFVEKRVRIVLHFMSLAASVWAFSEAMYGICTDFQMARGFYALYAFAFNVYVVLTCGYVGHLLKMRTRRYIAFSIIGLACSLEDFISFGHGAEIQFIIHNGLTTCYVPYSSRILYHWMYIVLAIVFLYSIAIIGGARTGLRRNRQFLLKLILAHLLLILSGLPEVVLPVYGIPAFPASGIGVTMAYLMLCHFTIQGNQFSLSEDNLFDAVYQNSTVAILVINPDGLVTQANPYASQLFGSIRGNPHVRTLFTEPFDAVFDGILHGETVLEHLTAVDSETPLHIHPIVYDDAFGDPYAVILICSDATDEKLVMEQRYIIEQEKEKNDHIRKLTGQIVKTLSSTIDAKDRYTNGHSSRVAQYSLMLAEQLHLSPESMQELEYAALLHDVGKIGIPDEIIKKNSRLSQEEYEVIKDHPIIGDQILANITEIPSLKIGARWHHEWYNGKGYPDGKKGEETDLFARIIGVADAYDAMTSNRRYRGQLTQEAVREQFVKGRGTQFDPEITDLMLAIIDADPYYELREIEEL